MTISQQYKTEAINSLSEVELIEAEKNFKREYLPAWKFAAFIGYHFTALTSMGLYAYSFKAKMKKPHQRTEKIHLKELTLLNLVKKGSKHGLIISGLYIGGLCILVPYIFPFEIFFKLTEIQNKIHSFSARFDPFYQQTMLFAKMRKSGLSEELIEQIAEELRAQKSKLIQTGGLKPETIKHLTDAEIWYAQKHQEAKGLDDFA